MVVAEICPKGDAMEVFRGSSTAFEATFVDIDGVPLVPADATQWPQVVVKDPDGNVVTTTVGSPVGSGIYRVSWYCPDDATINQQDRPWRIDWAFLTITGHSRSSGETFDVVDKIEVDPQERQQSYLTMAGTTEQIMIRFPRRIKYLSLAIKSQGGGIVRQVDAIATTPEEQNPLNPNRLIVETRLDGQYRYYYTTDPLQVGEYQCQWQSQENDAADRHNSVQLLRVPPDVYWHYATDLKTMVDKLQKRIGTVQAYAPSDIYVYLHLGVDAINFIAPTTNWALSDIPLNYSRGVRGALLYSSMVQALIAQQILSEELSFNHTGLTVNISVKHDYSAVIAAIKVQIDEFAKAKPQIFRLSEGAAWSGVRPKNWRSAPRVFRADRGLWGGMLPPDGSTLLRNIGL